MKQEFAIADDWLPFEIHPDTPQQGVLWKDYFPGMVPEAFFRQLNERSQAFGVRFGPQPLMSNSREALAAGEFAKELGRYDAYHEAVFRAFFTDCLDIGNREVILDIARKTGLDAQTLIAALEDDIYGSRLQQTTLAARDQGIRSAPTFLIEDYGSITGAQPIDTFRAALREAQKEAQSATAR